MCHRQPNRRDLALNVPTLKVFGSLSSRVEQVVEFDPSTLPWEDFRGKVLGPTDPKDAPADSLRGIIMAKWEALGLSSAPDTGNNGVHASASPFEGLAERINWLQLPMKRDAFARLLLDGGIPEATIKEWSVDPQVSE